MQFSLKALFVVTSLACVAAAFPKSVAVLLVILIVSGLAVSWLFPIEPDDWGEMNRRQK
jgi:hypothetical protein